MRAAAAVLPELRRLPGWAGRAVCAGAVLLAAVGCSPGPECPDASHGFLGRYWQADERLADRLGGMPACFALYPAPHHEAVILWANGDLEDYAIEEVGPGVWVGENDDGIEVEVSAEYFGDDLWEVRASAQGLSRTWTAGRCRWL